MKKWMQRWTERIDAMVLRERVIVFFATTLLMMFLYYALIGTPASDRLKTVARDLAKKQADTRVLQDQVQVLLGQRKDDPDTPLNRRLQELKAHIAQADLRLAEHQRGFVSPERIPQMLGEILRRDRRLELVDLRSLPTTDLFTETAAGTDSARPIKVYRHGVELTVRGEYFDLLQYLTALEQLPYRMFWKDLDLAATDYPRITMKLTVYTLSLERNWVIV